MRTSLPNGVLYSVDGVRARRACLAVGAFIMNDKLYENFVDTKVCLSGYLIVKKTKVHLYDYEW